MRLQRVEDPSTNIDMMMRSEGIVQLTSFSLTQHRLVPAPIFQM